MIEQTIYGNFVAVHHVEYALRQTGLTQEIGDEHRSRRILLRWLEDERIPTHQRIGEHPHRHHRREVERRDSCHHSEGLADRIHIDATRGLLGVAALQQSGDATRELDVLDTASDFAECVARHFAVLEREDRGELLAVGIEQLAHPEHDLGTTRHVRRAPRGKCRLGDGNHRIHLFDGREIHLGLLLTRSRVEHLARAARGATHHLVVHPVTDSLHDSFSAR